MNSYFVLGCVLSVGGSVIDNWGMNLQKLAHKNLEAGGNIYFSGTWIFGFAIYVFGQVMNFVALSLIDQPTQSILSSFALFSNLVFAKYYFNEVFKKSDLVGLFCVSCGASIFILFFVHRKQIYTIPQLEYQFYQPQFLYLCAFLVMVISTCLIYVNSFSEAILARYKIIGHIANAVDTITCSEKGESTALAYALIAAVIGGGTVTFSKIISVVIPALVADDTDPTISNTLPNTDPEGSGSFLFMIVCIWLVLIIWSVHALNIGLKNSPALVMIPIFYVLSNMTSILVGTIYFEEYETFESPGLTLACLFGLVLTLNGIHMLSKRVASAKANDSPRYRLHVGSINSVV